MGKSLPIVSVIIPCFNYGQYLNEAIRSILSQTLQDFEIIVVDDGSTDELTKKVFRELQHEKIQVFHQENRGLSAARNAGIHKAKGEFIVPLDADDKLHPTYIEKCLWMFEHNPGVGFVYTGSQTFGDYEYTWFENYDLRELLKRNFIPATALYRKKDWERVGGYNESFIVYEDWELWLHFAEEEVYGTLLPEPLFLYRKHSPSMLKNVGEPNLPKIQKEIQRLHTDLYQKAERIDPTFFSGILPVTTVPLMVAILKRDEDQIQEYKSKIENLGETQEVLKKELREVRASLQGKTSEMDAVYQSRGWKIISFLHKMRMKIPFLRNL